MGGGWQTRPVLCIMGGWQTRPIDRALADQPCIMHNWGCAQPCIMHNGGVALQRREIQVLIF